METITISKFKATCLAVLERVRQTREPVIVTIPDRESEHSTQVVHHCLALIGIEVQKHFGVRAAAEDVAFPFKSAPEFPVVVDLAIEGHDEFAVSACHRLRACVRQVDDRQPPMAEAHTAVAGDPLAFPVWSPHVHVVASAREFCAVNRVRRVVIGVDAVNSAHISRGSSVAAQPSVYP